MIALHEPTAASVAGIATAIICGLILTQIFNSDKLAVIPALLAGYIMYRFVSFSLPFWIWMSMDGAAQMVCMFVIAVCIFGVGYLFYRIGYFYQPRFINVERPFVDDFNIQPPDGNGIFDGVPPPVNPRRR